MTAAKTPAKTEATAVANPSADGFEEFAGAGLEHVGAADLLVPRLTILQTNSPQLKKNKGEYIENAAEGMIADVGTGEVFPDGVLFLPVHYAKVFIEWAPRESGKGLIAIHTDPAILDECERDEQTRKFMYGENTIAETAQFFGLNLSAGRRWSFIPMSSTQLKKAKRWNTLAMGEKLRRADGTEYVAPLFYRTYQLGTAEEDNNKGDWIGWTLSRGPALPELTMDDHGMDWRTVKAEAVAFRDSIVKGEARGDLSGVDEEAGSGNSSDDENRRM